MKLTTAISIRPVGTKQVNGPLWAVRSLPAHRYCPARIGPSICGAKRPSIGNLPSRPTILSLKTNCLSWRPCAGSDRLLRPIAACAVAKADMKEAANCRGLLGVILL